MSLESWQGQGLHVGLCEGKSKPRSEFMRKPSQASGGFPHEILKLTFGVPDFPLFCTLASNVTKQANPQKVCEDGALEMSRYTFRPLEKNVAPYLCPLLCGVQGSAPQRSPFSPGKKAGSRVSFSINEALWRLNGFASFLFSASLGVGVSSRI